MSTIKLKSSDIETIEIVKCTSGFIVYLHDGQGEVAATKAISALGYAGYAGVTGSVLEAIQAAFTVSEGD